MEGVPGRRSRSPSHGVAVEAASAESDEAGLRALWRTVGDGNIRGPGFVACLSGTTTLARAAEQRPKRAVAVCQAPSSGELEGPLDDESGCDAELKRVLVFDMWIANVGQTHLWLVGCAYRKVREDSGSSSSGTEAALASCRGKTQRP